MRKYSTSQQNQSLCKSATKSNNKKINLTLTQKRQKPQQNQVKSPSLTTQTFHTEQFDIGLTANENKQPIYDMERQINELKQSYKTLKQSHNQQEQLLYIYKSYFNKLEEIYYGKSSGVLDNTQINHQKVQMYLRDLLMRINEGDRKKLKNAPTIYKKNNIRTIINRQQ